MAPEVIAGGAPGKASDVWSLGCTIFRLRAGKDIFFDYDTHSPYEALLQIQKFVGDLPDYLARAQFNKYGFPAAEGEDGRPINPDHFLDRMTLEEKIGQI